MVSHDESFLFHQCAQEQAHQGRWENMVVCHGGREMQLKAGGGQFLLGKGLGWLI